MDTTLIIGLAGMVLILIAFILTIFKYLDPNSKTDLLLNLIGSALLVWYALLLGSVPFLILNAVWACAAGWRLVRGLQ
jgi:hypothetical protein